MNASAGEAGEAGEAVLEVATNPLLAADTSTTGQLAGGDMQSGQSDEQQRLVFDIEEWNRHVAHDPSVVIGLPGSHAHCALVLMCTHTVLSFSLGSYTVLSFGSLTV